VIVEIGHFALVLALCAALAQTVMPFWGARVGAPDLMAVGQSSALTQLALVAIAFAALARAVFEPIESLRIHESGEI
jgi:cytochrome c-type biogenesis protein CcmF